MSIRNQVILPTLNDMKLALSKSNLLKSNLHIPSLDRYNDTKDVIIEQAINEGNTLKSNAKTKHNIYGNHSVMSETNIVLNEQDHLKYQNNLTQVENVSYTPRGKFQDGAYI